MLMVIGTAATFVFFLAEEFVPEILSKPLAWVTLIIGGFFVSAGEPIWWEMACESVYPVPEEIVGTLFALGFTIVGVIFYGLYSFPQLGPDWVNWVLFLSELLCTPMILFYSGEKRRLHDDQIHVD